MGWDVPVLEGYSCAITLCKALVDLGVTVFWAPWLKTVSGNP